MTTGYTRQQLHRLTEAFNSNVPINYGSERKKKIKTAKDFAIASDAFGVLLRLTFDYGTCKDFFLNCVAAREILTELTFIRSRHGWLETEPAAVPFESSAPVPTMLDGETAIKAISLKVEPHCRGVRLFFACDEIVFRCLVHRNIARQLLASIQQAGDIAAWWDDKIDLQPLPHQLAPKKVRNAGPRTRQTIGAPAPFWGDYRTYITKIPRST